MLFSKEKNHGHMKIPGYPIIPFVFPMLTMMGYLCMALWLTKRITRALEVMALSKALHDMGDRLSSVETADLEGRIRQNLFP
ncbi:MAG TPA: hypothetical protein VGM23_10550 [Armatimonadota bacterium]|jgi:hypothetical protein